MSTNVELAIRDWKKSLKTDQVVTQEEAITGYETTNFTTSQRIAAVLCPRTTTEVAACVRIAQQHAVPVYPVSRGRNWGLGSRVPIETASAVIDLEGMNGIEEYSEKYGYLVVQPGVSFHQAARYLEEQNSPFFVSVIGGTGEGSLVGNLLERGDGSGHYAERADFACAFEVVFPDGSVGTTGFGGVEGSTVKHLCKWGVGPNLDGLLAQSGFGIVTRMTVWLTPKPKRFEMFVISANEDRDVIQMIDGIRDLQLRRELLSPVYLLNDYKHLANVSQYPWKEAAGATPLPEAEYARLQKEHGTAKWRGISGIYANNGDTIRGIRRSVRKKLGAADMLVFLNEQRVGWLRRLAAPLRWVGLDPAPALDLWDNHPLMGRPTDRSVRGVYWRKKSLPEGRLDPDRDGCGIYWNCVVIPMDGQHFVDANRIASETILRHRFEPNLAAMLSSGYGRSIRLFVMFTYDRDNEGADEAAHACQMELFDAFEAAGYTHNRLDILSMDRVEFHPEVARALSKIKDALDPNGIMSPGRYEPLRETEARTQRVSGRVRRVDGNTKATSQG